jgi:hypothetical protein
MNESDLPNDHLGEHLGEHKESLGAELSPRRRMH